MRDFKKLILITSLSLLIVACAKNTAEEEIQELKAEIARLQSNTSIDNEAPTDIRDEIIERYPTGEKKLVVTYGGKGNREFVLKKRSYYQNGQIKEEEKALQAKAEEVVDFLSISHLKNERAGNLSGGQKKLLELARTMMVDAKVVLLDEVGAGVNRTLLKQIGDAIVRLNEERGYTFCMIEHDMDFISRLCDPVVVLAEGQILTTGTPDEIKSSDAVIEAYLGKGIKTEAAN